MMPTRKLTAPALAVALICWASAIHAQQIEVYFSPRGGCAAAVCRLIDSATTSVYVQAYALTHPKITASIHHARQRGLAVAVIVTPTQTSPKASTAPALSAAGVAVYADNVERIHHNKIVIVDATHVATGSFNYTISADLKNAENLLIVHDTATAAIYTRQFFYHLAHSRRLKTTGSAIFPHAPPRKRSQKQWHVYQVP